MKEIAAQRAILKTLIKQVIARIKEVQQEKKDTYTTEAAYEKQAIENELVSWKISLEKWSKKLKHQYEANK